MTSSTSPDQCHHRFCFCCGTLALGVLGLIELSVGGLSLIVPLTTVRGELVRLADILETKRSLHLLAPDLLHLASQLATVNSWFITLYFGGGGLAMLLLAGAVWYHQRFALPVSLIILSLFVCSQLYLTVIAMSGILIILTLCELVTLGLLFIEYRTEQLTKPNLPLRDPTITAEK